MVIADAGIDPERFAIEWVSSAEAPRFAEVVTRFTEKIRQLGPINAADSPVEARLATAGV
jgi:F420-non-reducing hydrogenase iron-sulfur subunit